MHAHTLISDAVSLKSVICELPCTACLILMQNNMFMLCDKSTC